MSVSTTGALGSEARAHSASLAPLDFSQISRPSHVALGTQARTAADLRAPDPQLFKFEVPEGYRQGRGAFGGLVVAALTRAVDQVEADPARSLRSLSSTIVAPVTAGSASIWVTPVRIGNGVSTWQSTLEQDGEIRAQASLVYGKQRIQEPGWSPTPPEMGKGWAAVDVAPIRAPLGPEFAQHFEFRSTGPLPFSGSPVAEASGWIRTRPALPTLAAADVLALADAWWPCALAREPAPRPMATLAYTAQLLIDPAELDGAPLYYRARADVQVDGFSVEFRELWTERGQLVLLNQQTFVVIR